MSTNKKPYRVMVLGLDGVTWELLDPWVKQGLMPNLGKLREDGVWGDLASTVPPFSATAWSSFATGMNPAKHGIFDFWRKGSSDDPSLWRLPISSRDIGAPTLWQRLSRAGRRVAVMNVPVTYPPAEVNGILIAGMMTPSDDAAYTQPPALKEEILAKFERYTPAPFEAITQSKAFLKNAIYWVKQREKVHRYLWDKEKWDFFMNVVQAPDAIQHFFITFFDPQHPDYNHPQAEGFRKLALTAYKEMDDIIAQRRALLDDNTVLIVMSDHGAGEARWWFNLNLWLHHQGLLAFQEMSGGRSRLAKLGITETGVANLLRHLDIFQLRGKLRNKFRRKLRQTIDRAVSPEIDWAHSRAYSGSLTAEAIYLNVKGRDPFGIVEPGEEYDRICQQIITHLKALRGPDGEPVVKNVYRRDELYEGPFFDRAPDLLVEIGWQKYLISDRLSGDSYFEEIDFAAARGRHRPLGVLVAYGKPFRQGAVYNESRLIDLAPTVMHLQGLPVPRTMDGRVLEELFDSSWLAEHPVQYSDEDEMLGHEEEHAYSEEDVEAITEHLRALGYLE